MRLLIQRVRQARVEVRDPDGRVRPTGEIGPGLLVLAGFGAADGLDLPAAPVWSKMLEKLLDLRIFPDDGGHMNRSLRDVGGELLVVSQFTLYADCRRGRRPSFSAACPPETARALYERLLADLAARAPHPPAAGEFGADMAVHLTNWGPVTLQLDAADFA
ncbi:MAG: D-aminoacyl-tRNA deacylase [Desulfovibrionaceae bacterium]